MNTKINHKVELTDLKDYKKTLLPQIKKGHSVNLINNQNQSIYNDKDYTSYAVIIPTNKYKQLHLRIGKYLAMNFFDKIVHKYPQAKAIAFDSKVLRVLLPNNESAKLKMTLNPQDIHSYFLYWLQYNHDHFTPNKTTDSPSVITVQLVPSAKLNASTPIRDGVLTIDNKKFRYSVTDSALCPTDYDTFLIRRVYSRNKREHSLNHTKEAKDTHDN